MKKIIKIICLLLIVIIITGAVIKNEEEQTNVCKRVLYEEDYIMLGCDKYFKKEKWYKDYMKEVNKFYEDYLKEYDKK